VLQSNRVTKLQVCAFAMLAWMPSAEHITAAVLYVDANSTNPTPPFTNWLTAATSIQDAVDTTLVGDFIWVTNGIYQTGGRATAGDADKPGGDR
jgi:hypothetical protein